MTTSPPHDQRSMALFQRRAVVMGGLGLVGAAISVALAEMGAGVTVVDRDEAAFARAEAGFRDAELDIGFRRADATELDGAAELVADLAKAPGGFDIWVNCHYPRTADWGQAGDRMTVASWRQNVEMHLTGYCLFADEAARTMAAQEGGSIINIASIYGVVGPDFGVYEGTTDMTTPAPYAAIKGGIIAHTRFLASQWGGQGVRVNAVCPGGIFAHQQEAFLQNYAARTPLGRLAQPAEIAAPVAFLAGDGASYITGAVLMVDGGWTAI